MKKKELDKKRMLTNNMLTLLIISFALISLLGNLAIYKSSAPKITGYAVDTETTTVGFCIMPSIFQNISYIYPKSGDILSGNVTLNATVEGADSGIVMDFYYVLSDPLYTTTTTAFIGNDSYDGNIYYNVTWNTSTVADGNYLYRINFTATNLSGGCRIQSYNLTGYFTVNNINVQPNWTNFYYNMTTNFSLLTSWVNLSNVIISNPNVTINYSGQYINLDSYSLDNNFMTYKNNITFNMSACPLCINRTMFITLINLTFTDPKIMRNGRECEGYCEFINYSRGNLTFKVLGIGSYTAEENATYMDIFDEVDIKGGNAIKFDRDYIRFSANFSFLANYSVIPNTTGAFCSIRFNVIGTYTDYSNMSYNSTSTLYYYDYIVGSSGTFDWDVLCNANAIKQGTNLKTDNVTVLQYTENLTLSDESDTVVKYVDDRVMFYANYSDISAYSSNRSRPLAGNGIWCEISFAYNLTGVSGFTGTVYNETGLSWTTPINMTYNSSSYLYEYNRTFDYAGTMGSMPFYGWHLFNVSCYDNLLGFYNLTEQSNFKITNIAPALTIDIPNVTMEEDTVYYLDRLSNYFSDADGDTITYNKSNVLNIEITIDSNSIAKIKPNANFYGSRQVTFYAYDIYDARGDSNVVNITVTDIAEPAPTPGIDVVGTEAPETGGEGTGSDDPGKSYPDCIANWTCTDWGPCLITNISVRSCSDQSHCGHTYKPEMSMKCDYVPTCDDLIKNQEEEGVDCGGPCPKCPTCSDSIRNQNEEDIDCGGPCRPCPSCDDGLKNQNETGVDCGGPCPECKVFERPGEYVGRGGLLGITTQFIKEKTLNTVEFFNKSIMLSILTIVITLMILLVGAEMKYKFIKKRVDKKIREIKEKKKIKEASPGKKLGKLKEKIKSEDVNELLSDLYNIATDIFYSNFKTKLNLTEEELNSVLQDYRADETTKNKIIGYYNEVNRIRFSEVKLDKQNIKALINKSEKINTLISENTNKLLKRAAKLKGYIEEIDKSISKHDQSKVNKYYKKISESYEHISPEQKKEINSEINKLGLKIKNLQGKGVQ